jgi:hypothetical protein
VEGNLSAEAKAHRLARACAIADFADKSVFVEDPDAPEEGRGEDEEMAEAEEADPAADSQVPRLILLQPVFEFTCAPLLAQQDNLLSPRYAGRSCKTIFIFLLCHTF